MTAERPDPRAPRSADLEELVAVAEFELGSHPSPMTTLADVPRTKAGQELDLAWPGSHIDRQEWRRRILAIETEASRLALPPEDVAAMREPEPLATEAIHRRDDPTRHQDDSYGGCTVCRVWVEGEGDDEVYLPFPFPCPTVRLAEAARSSLSAAVEAALGPER